jgi:hypothetical protein
LGALKDYINNCKVPLTLKKVKHFVLHKWNLNIPISTLSVILKTKLKMRYKSFVKIVKQSTTFEISQARIVKAHLLSHSLIAGKIIVNIDESSFEDVYLNTKTWSEKG